MIAEGLSGQPLHWHPLPSCLPYKLQEGDEGEEEAGGEVDHQVN